MSRLETLDSTAIASAMEHWKGQSSRVDSEYVCVCVRAVLVHVAIRHRSRALYILLNATHIFLSKASRLEFIYIYFYILLEQK